MTPYRRAGPSKQPSTRWGVMSPGGLSPVTHPMHLLKIGTMLLLGGLLHPLHAAGPTSEAEAHAAYVFSHRPVWVSTDGAWRVSVNPRGELLREAQTDKPTVQRIKLGPGVRAVASHGPGLKVWVLGEKGCLLQVDFSGPTPKRQTESGAKCPALDEAGSDDLPSYFSGSLAVSADGQLLAHSGSEGDPSVTVLDLRNKKKPMRTLWPAHPAVALRFEDDGQRLAVLTQERGEAWEDIPGPSSLQWSRWDLRSGALWNEAQREGGLGELRLHLHSASAWQQFWLDAKGEVQALDTHSCPVRVHSWPLKNEAAIESLSADPLGRWLAVLAAPTQAKTQRLLWLDARTGRTLHISELPLPRGAQGVAVQAHAQGLLLRRASAVQRSGEQYDHSPWRLQPWQNLPLPPAVAALAPRETSPTAPCREAKEAPLARQPERIAQPGKILWTLELDPRKAWDEARKGPCNRLDWTAEHQHPDRTPRRWGLSPQGQLFVDQGDELHQLDPGTGKLLARWPTQRPTGVCSTPSFARAQFLNWQGDTLSLRPFAAQWDPKARQTLEQRPGWRVVTAVWLGDQVLARWVKGEQAEQRLYRADASGRWTQAAQRKGSVQEDGMPWFEGDDGHTSAIGWHELMPDPAAIDNIEREERGVRAGPRWSAGRYDSVRAEQDGRLLLWDGVSGDSARVGQLVDLGQGRAVSLAGARLTLYRLREGEQSALRWEQQGRPDGDSPWIDALWWDEPKLLLLAGHGGTLVALRPPLP